MLEEETLTVDDERYFKNEDAAAGSLKFILLY